MLLAITPGDGRDLGPWFEALSGFPAVLVREPAAPDLEALVARARPCFGEVVVHARHPDGERLARERGWTLHLSSDAPVLAGVAWSRSAHTEAEVDAALEAGARFVVWSPVARPTSKPADRRAPLGVPRFLAHARGRPVLALGGVDAELWAALRAGGATGAAVSGHLFGVAPAEAGRRARALVALGGTRSD